MFRFLLPFLLFLTLFAQEPQDSHAIMAGFRAATIPYSTNRNDTYMYSFLPWMWFEGEHFYMRGNRYGIHLYKDALFECNVLAKIRHVDMPRSADTYFSGDVVDSGISLHVTQDSYSFVLEWMQDGSMRSYAELFGLYAWHTTIFDITPFASLQYRDKRFNRYYFGAKKQLHGDFAPALGIESTLNLTPHMQLYTRLKSEYLGQEAQHAQAIKRPYVHEVIAGIRLGTWNNFYHYNHKTYLRIGWGIATLGSFSQLLSLSAPSDPYANKMLSLFYGYQLQNTIFGKDSALYLHSGVALHVASAVQNEALEGVSAFKLFFDLPYDFKLGVATGISYISETTYVERWANKKDGYKESSQLMNHLDFSLEYLLDTKLSVGYEIFHRSGIFESVQSYGQIKGGSNYHHLFVKAYM